MAHQAQDRYFHKRNKEQHAERLERKARARARRKYLRNQREAKALGYGEPAF